MTVKIIFHKIHSVLFVFFDFFLNTKALEGMHEDDLASYKTWTERTLLAMQEAIFPTTRGGSGRKEGTMQPGQK